MATGAGVAGLTVTSGLGVAAGAAAVWGWQAMHPAAALRSGDRKAILKAVAELYDCDPTILARFVAREAANDCSGGAEAGSAVASAVGDGRSVRSAVQQQGGRGSQAQKQKGGIRF